MIVEGFMKEKGNNGWSKSVRERKNDGKVFVSGPRAQNSSQKRSHVFSFFHVNAVMQTRRKGFVTLQILMYLMNAAFRSRL